MLMGETLWLKALYAGTGGMGECQQLERDGK